MPRRPFSMVLDYDLAIRLGARRYTGDPGCVLLIVSRDGRTLTWALDRQLAREWR